MTIETYMSDLEKAEKFTKEINLAFPKKITFDVNKRYFNDTGNKKLIEMYHRLFQHRLNNINDMRMFALGMIGNCSPFHYYLKRHVEELYNCQSYFTIGYVLLDEIKEKTFHKITQDDIKKCLNTGTFTKDHHAWLTLDSGEILDVTFPITLQSIQNEDFEEKLQKGEIELNLINRHVNDFTNSMTYKPVLIGDDFFTQIGFGLAGLSASMYN